LAVELWPIEDWSATDLAGNAVLLDPVRGDSDRPMPLDSTLAPAYMFTDERMFNGSFFLSQNAGRLVADSYLSPIEYAEDITAAAENSLSRADVAGYMYDDKTPDDRLDYFDNMLSMINPDEAFLYGFTPEEFEFVSTSVGYRDKLRALHRQARPGDAQGALPTFRFDVDHTNRDGDPVVAEHLDAIQQAIRAERVRTNNEMTQELLLAEFVEGKIRHDVLLLTMGSELAKLEDQGKLPRGEIGLTLTAGPEDQVLTHMLAKRYETPARATFMDPSRVIPGFRNGALARILNSCEVTHGDIADFFADDEYADGEDG